MVQPYKRRENDRIAKRVYVGECAGGCSVGRLWKKCINTVGEYMEW